MTGATPDSKPSSTSGAAGAGLDVQAAIRDAVAPISARMTLIDTQARTIMSALQEMAKGADTIKAVADEAKQSADAARAAAEPPALCVVA